jgi:hypothetical protein
LDVIERLIRSNAFRIVCALVGALVPVAWLLTLVTPSVEAVKVRNALVMQLGKPADFDWTPAETPATFLVNRQGVPAEFLPVARRFGPPLAPDGAGALDRALVVSRGLMGTAQRMGGAIQSDNLDAYRGITADGRGYCADFTQVFIAIAVASNLPVREWSIAFEEFGAGHAFNEIYDAGQGKWILVDSFHSLYFIDPDSREPLSVREVHDRLLGIVEDSPVEVRSIVKESFPFRSEALAIDYYRRGMPQLAMVWGNNVFDYERSAAVNWAGRVSRPLQQAIAIMLGIYPRSMIYPVGVSMRDVDELDRAGDRFLLAMACVLVCGLLFSALLYDSVRRSGGRSRGPRA